MIMKKLAVFFTFLALMGCSESKDDSPAAANTNNGSEYYAEYGIPDQALIQACSGEKSLVRPVTKCIRRSTNTIVNNSLCYNLEPVYMTIPSPSGQRQTPMPGGFSLDSCNEGSSQVIYTSYICNMGFFLDGTRCLSYETVGSYAIIKDQTYKQKDGLKILMTLGQDSNTKESGNLKMKMMME